MSVTFSTDPGQVVDWLLECGCGHTSRSLGTDSYGLACAALVAARVGLGDGVECANCADGWGGDMTITSVWSDPSPEVNVSNVNATDMLQVLGIDSSEELCGSLPADDFLGRVLVATAAAPDDMGRPAVTRGNVTLCARPVGYVQDVLDRLRTLAVHAAARGTTVNWG